MSAKLVYEMVTCSRCGGSGHYSYCQMHGTVCFKCGGRKRVASRAGAKAAAAVKDFIAANFSVKVRDLTPGTLVRVEGVTRRVVSVVNHGFNGGSVNGVPYESVTVAFNKPIKGFLGSFSEMGTSGDSVWVKAPAGADWDRVVAFARTIKKGVTIVEPEPVAS